MKFKSGLEQIARFYTYIYRDPSRNNEPFYVGKGTKRRAWSHLTRTDKHPFTYRLVKMKREGVSPDIEIIPALDEAHAYFMEECCIEVFGRKDLNKGPLLNLNDGGRGGQSGVKYTPEVLARRGKSISAALTGVRRGPQSRETVELRTQTLRSPEVAAKLGHSKGKSFPERGKQISAGWAKRTKKVCAHCGGAFYGSPYSRFHGENCRERANG